MAWSLFKSHRDSRRDGDGAKGGGFVDQAADSNFEKDASVHAIACSDNWLTLP
jgi:hypothetical protein